MLGSLRSLGFDTSRVVPVAFHVDYFNSPWKDVFSDNFFSKRQYEYSAIYKREHGTDENYLYFTPMLMVDGRYPMLGSDRAKAQSALKRSLADKPGVSIDPMLERDKDNPRSGILTASVRSLSPASAGRPLLIGVALYEDPVSTAVASGENAGETLVEHYAVRKFVYEKVYLTSSKPAKVSFPLTLGDGWDAAKCGVAVFVQNWDDGRVHQAESLSWQPREKTARKTAAR